MLYLITGGSGSGKSEYAEKLAVSMHQKEEEAGGLYYIATMYPYDAECRERICRHRAMRKGKGFWTQECFVHMEQFHAGKKDVVLLECMSNLLANEMYSNGGAGENSVPEIIEGIFHINRQARELVVVSNEVFSDLPVSKEMERYLSYLGEINRVIAEQAAEVTEVVYGIPVSLKRGEKTESHVPAMRH